MTKIACFITPHGFGHATRMTAVLEALQERIPDLHPHLFTTVPKSLFAETLKRFSYHYMACDIGLAQKDGLHADIQTSIQQLQEFLPFDTCLLNELAEKIQGCQLVLCDIAPIGIAVARIAGIKSVLIENFTWDWIYKAYLQDHPGLQPAISYLNSQYQQADVHIRCKPYCSMMQGDLECGPISRRIRTGRTEMRKRLRCKNKNIVLISMGGMDLKLPFINLLPDRKETFFILTGQEKTHRLKENILLLARDSEFYHPDLINAADLVICKSGYSTVAECAQAGVSIVTVGRLRFPESVILEKFSTSMLNGRSLEQADFLSGSWIRHLNQFCSPSRKPAIATKGADTAAQYLSMLL